MMDDPIYSSLSDIGKFSASSLCLSTIMWFIMLSFLVTVWLCWHSFISPFYSECVKILKQHKICNLIS